MVTPVQAAGISGVLRVLLNPRLIMLVALLGGAAAKGLRERRLRARREERSRRRAEERNRGDGSGQDDNGDETDERNP